jgi:hypothetical protein
MAPSRPKVVLNASRDIPFSKLMLPVSAECGPASRRAMPALPSPAAELARLLSEKAERVCRHYLSNGRRCGHYLLHRRTPAARRFAISGMRSRGDRETSSGPLIFLSDETRLGLI